MDVRQYKRQSVMRMQKQRRQTAEANLINKIDLAVDSTQGYLTSTIIEEGQGTWSCLSRYA